MNLAKFYEQPEADFEGGAFLGNGKGFVVGKDGRIVVLQAWHTDRNATQEEIANGDFFIAPLSAPCLNNHGGWAKDNRDFVVYDWDSWIEELNKRTIPCYRDQVLKALLEKGLIKSRKISFMENF